MRRRSQAGITLMELMIAVVLLSPDHMATHGFQNGRIFRGLCVVKPDVSDPQHGARRSDSWTGLRVAKARPCAKPENG